MNVGTPFRRSKYPAVIFVATTILSFSLANGVAAQTARFRSVDTNRDGVLGLDELEAAFGRAGALRLLSTMDRNRDGHITIPELRATQNEDRRSNNSDNNHNDEDDRNDDDRDDDGADRDDGSDGDKEDDD